MSAASSMADAEQTGIAGLDYVLGGGIARPSAVLIVGASGVGKTTLAMDLLRSLAERHVACMYIHAERPTRHGLLLRQFPWLNETPSHLLIQYLSEREEIAKRIERRMATVYVVDSLQTVGGVLGSSGRPLKTGGRSVVRLSEDFKALAHQNNASIVAIGHTTCDGSIAGGPRMKHVFDAVLSLVEYGTSRRILAVLKSRFAQNGLRAERRWQRGWHDRHDHWHPVLEQAPLVTTEEEGTDPQNSTTFRQAGSDGQG